MPKRPSFFLNAFAIGCALLVAAPALAQTYDPADMKPGQEYNPQSIRPVAKSEIMFKKSLWFRVNTIHKINRGFASNDFNFVDMLIQAVIDGKLQPYYSDTLNRKMPRSKFMEQLIIPGQNSASDPLEALSAPGSDLFGGFGDSGGEMIVPGAEADFDAGTTPAATGFKDGLNYYLPKQLYLFEIKEDLIFDRRHSRMKHDILAITIVIPATENPLGLEEELCSFSYKDIYYNLFKQKNEETGAWEDNPEAAWFNARNSGEHRNLADAFDLRLFNGRLVKYENFDGSAIVELYGQSRRGLEVSEQYLMRLLEYEHNLWSY